MSIPPSEFLRAFFGAYSEAPVFLVSLPNQDERGRQAGPQEVLTRDPATIDGFVHRWDRKGRGLYFCVNTIREGAMPREEGKSRRIKENIAEIVTAHTEVDAKSILVSLDDVIAAVQNLPHPPSVVVRSGNGLHLYWLLSEGITADPESIARVEALNAQLGDLVGGDPVHDVTRLLRVPGTHNSKGGSWTEVQIVEARDEPRHEYEPRHEIADLEEMVAMLSPIVKRKPVARAPGAPVADNPFLRVAAQYGFKPPVDVEQRLAVMSLGGPGDSSIHSTQLAVSASLMNRGTPIDDIVDMLITATKAAVGPDGARWNWDREDRAIRQMCTDWQRKNPDHRVRALPRASVSDAVVTAPSTASEEAHEEQPSAPTADGTNVVSFAAKGSKGNGKGGGKAPKDKDGDKTGLGTIVAEGVIQGLRDQGEDILIHGGEIHLYRDGIWSVADRGDQTYLKSLIQDGCDALGRSSNVSILNAAWKRLNESSLLIKRHVPWGAGGASGHVVLANGVLDLQTRSLSDWSPDHYYRTKVDTAYDPAAQCPTFLKFLDSAFKHLDTTERALVIGTVQEFFGSALCIPALKREQRKGLLLLGASRSGKTQLSLIFQTLIGARIASPKLVEIADAFGLEDLLNQDAWVRDDAVSEGDVIDPARTKTVITGEATNVRRKFLGAVPTKFEIPVFFTTNELPKARDMTDALYNRFIVIRMDNVIDERDVAAAQQAIGVPDDRGVGEYIGETEAAGILNWALDGLDRLRGRKRFELPESIVNAVESFKQSNNIVAEWASIALESAPGYMVSRKDLGCCFNGWERAEYGGSGRMHGGKYLMQRLRQLKHLGMIVDGPQLNDGERYVVNVKLTPEGLKLWKDHHDYPHREGSMGSSKDTHEVNRAAPAAGAPTKPKTEF